jgi:Family of unknown function (DUF5677)
MIAMLEGEDLLHTDTAAGAHFAPLLDLGRRLLQFGSVLPPAGSIRYSGASPTHVTGAVMALFVSATKTMRGIQLLGANVLTEPGIMLLRSLSDNWAALGFIAAEPAKRAERAHWYLLGEMVANYKWGKGLLDANLTTLIPPAVLGNPQAVLDDAKRQLRDREIIERGAPGADDRAEAMLKRMRQGNWGGVTTEEMYGVAERWANRSNDPAAVYVTIFRFASGILHVQKPDMFLKMADNGTITPNLRADPTYLSFALFMGCLLYTSVLQAINEIFGQPWTRSIQAFLDDLGAWARAAKATKAPTSVTV